MEMQRWKYKKNPLKIIKGVFHVLNAALMVGQLFASKRCSISRKPTIKKSVGKLCLHMGDINFNLRGKHLSVYIQNSTGMP